MLSTTTYNSPYNRKLVRITNALYSQNEIIFSPIIPTVPIIPIIPVIPIIPTILHILNPNLHILCMLILSSLHYTSGSQSTINTPWTIH